MTGPFTGLRILDFSRDKSGKYASMIMSDMGAEVIRVDHLEDKVSVDPEDRLFNRGKKSITLELMSEKGSKFLNELVKSSDLLIHTWLAKEAKAAFLDYDNISNMNESLIYCSIPPYGDSGPMADIPGDDGTVAAFTGIHEGQGGETGTPLFVRLPLVSYGTAFTACLAISAAILEREQSGLGQKVVVPLYSGSAAIQSTSFITGENLPAPRKRPATASGGLPTYRLYECSDGWIFMACGNDVFWNKLCIAMEIFHFLEDDRFSAAPWGIAAENWHLLSEVLEPIFASNTRDHWLKFLNENDIPCGPAETREWFKSHPQVEYNKVLLEIEDPVLGPTIQPGPPIFMSKSPAEVCGPAPTIGKHNEEIKKSLQSVSLPKGTSKTHPLEGIKVLDLTGYIAGSFGTTLLSDLGADVLKIESFAGDGFRQNSTGFKSWNQGKRGMILNLKEPEGLDIFHQLVRESDIVAENFRGGITKRLKVDYEHLKEVNPQIIYSTVTGYGSSGPSSSLPAFDPLIQAQGGAMRDQGGNDSPVFLRVAASDYSSALLSAFGMVSALYHRSKTGEGQRIEISLVNSAFAYQAFEYFDYEGKNETPRLGKLGQTVDYRLYQAKDGWLFLSCIQPGDWNKLCEVTNKKELKKFAEITERRASDRFLNNEIEPFFATRTVNESIELLRSVGIKCSPNLSIRSVHNDPQAKILGLLAETVAFDLGEISILGLPFQFSRTPGKLELPAPNHGEHTDEILMSLGKTSKQILDLHTRSIVG